MIWILNLFLTIIATLWSLWVCGWERANFEAPFLKWVLKCWEAKEKNGSLAWNEFLAMMKYLSLHYIQKHSEAEELYRYADYVDVADYYRYIQQGDIKMPNEENTFNDSPSNKTHDVFVDEQREPITENRKEWWQEEYKPYTSFEPHKKQINKNALEESIGSMINAHRQRYQEEGDKTVRSILKPKLYPNANIQLFSDTNQHSVIRIQFNTADERDVELHERLKTNHNYKLFTKDDTDGDTVSLYLDFHNDMNLAKKTILDILMTVYNQPQECAINYINNVSGYTMQEQGTKNSSGCGLWTWFWILVVAAVIIWIIM